MRETKIGDATIYQGHVLDVLRQLPAESVNCVVTSPPYWGLRDYGIEPQVWDAGGGCAHEWGKEKIKKSTSDTASGIQGTPRPGNDYIASLGSFCRLCGAWRGSLGLEPTPELYVKHMVAVFEAVRRVLRKDGTCWVNMGDSYASGGNGARDEERWPKQSRSADGYKSVHIKKHSGLKPKDLCMIPARVALALQAAGWWLRQDIIWSKSNPMPESVTDRCTRSHEYVFLLTKAQRYYYNVDAVLEECSESTHMRISQNLAAQVGSFRANGGNKTNGPMKAVVRGKTAKAGDGIKSNDSFNSAMAMKVEKRNKRSVWEIPSQPFAEAHFATYPEKLVEPCILAGCPPGGIVLDPFNGSGTTGAVAIRLGRKYHGIELKPEYIEIAARRIGKADAEKITMFEAEEIEPQARSQAELFPACPED